MGMKKARKQILHEPSTHEIFHCISTMPMYSKILLEQYPDKPYAEFLCWLIDKNFYKGLNEKITIKRISVDFGIDTGKVTKWIKEIYEQIFELNSDKPELFQNTGIKVYMYIKHYDSSCIIYTSLQVLPRESETVKFPFAEAKVGIDFFWVQKVEHEIEDDTVLVTLWLVGGFINKYREFALDKALFQGWIDFMDVYELNTFELDDKINKLYRT